MTHSPSARPTRNRRAGTAALLTALLLLLGAGAAPAAWAHTDLASSDPADGSTVEQPPTALRLVFADPVAAPDPSSSALTIAVAGAAPVEIPATVDGDTVSADLTGVSLPSGAAPAEWEIAYRLVATDGDTFTGNLTFTVAAASAPETPASTATSTPGEPTATDPSPTEASATSAAPATEPTAPITTAEQSAPTTTTEQSAAAPGTTDVTTTADTSTPAPTTSTSSSAAPAATDGGGSAGWWFAGLALVVLLAGGGYWYARSRRAEPQG